MNNVVVFLYAYKNKNIKNTYNVLKNSASKNNNIGYIIFDQNNEDRSGDYTRNIDIKYNHIFWDRRDGVGKYRNTILDSSYDYYLEVSNLDFIIDNWDEYLISNYVDNSIFVKNNDWYNNDFIFTNKKTSNILKGLKDTKFYGQSIHLEYLSYINNINIVGLDNKIFSASINTLLLSDYVPYNLYNNYNNVLSIVCDDDGFIKFYKEKYNLDLTKNKTIKYNTDDLKYNNLIYETDSLQVNRFNRVIKTMQKVKK